MKVAKNGRQALAADTIPRIVLGRELQRRVRAMGVTRSEAAKFVDDAATQMSRIMTGHIYEFSADRLAKFLVRLGCDIDVVIKHPGRGERPRRGRVKTRVVQSRVRGA